MYHSHKIRIANLELGGDARVVLQSMTNTDTNDIKASVEQCIRIFEAGGEMVRLTTQSLKEVISLKQIHSELHRLGYDQPLVADVHFQPKLAEEAAKIVEKVRINPGNYIERKYTGPGRFNLSEQRRQTGIIREKILPLIRICKEHDTAIRIGVNHGSLSERILNWYGNSPEGMVESALEFIRVFREEKFDKLVISLKASNTGLMIQANRLLVKKMLEEEIHFPIHLGVTEAGDEEDGRIKSALGIGSLLSAGIGDTLRVSLTEDPEFEIPVAEKIREFFGERNPKTDFFLQQHPGFQSAQYQKRLSLPVARIGGNYAPIIISGSGNETKATDAILQAGYEVSEDKVPVKSWQSADYIFLGNCTEDTDRLSDLKKILSLDNWKENCRNDRYAFPLLNWREFGIHIDRLKGIHFISVNESETPDRFFEILEDNLFGVLVLSLEEGQGIKELRSFFLKLWKLNILTPVILHKKYNSSTRDELIIRASTELGSLLSDGFGDGLWLEEENPDIPPSDTRKIAFGILQATGTRISKTEYISCPSCGRTLFKIQNVLKEIKAATAEFTGLKIGVMGCIVNGPGEMADADFGYVGAGRGLVSLYKGKEAVKKNIPEEKAVEELVNLIRENLPDKEEKSSCTE